MQVITGTREGTSQGAYPEAARYRRQVCVDQMSRALVTGNGGEANAFDCPGTVHVAVQNDDGRIIGAARYPPLSAGRGLFPSAQRAAPTLIDQALETIPFRPSGWNALSERAGEPVSIDGHTPLVCIIEIDEEDGRIATNTVRGDRALSH